MDKQDKTVAEIPLLLACTWKSWRYKIQLMSSRTEQLIVEKTLPSGRLDIYLRDKFPAVSEEPFSV